VPNVLKTTVTERMGVHFSGYLLSLAGIIFRETSNTDTAVDGQIELVDENQQATGKLAGVQIKSGDSFTDVTSQSFIFRADLHHFEYWDRFCLPTIGIVYSPTLNKAVWFDLQQHSAQIVAEAGPLQITQQLSPNNDLGVEQHLRNLVNLVRKFHGLPVTLTDVEKVAEIQEEHSQANKEIAWKRLTTMFLDSQSAPDVLTAVGQRISYYFPTVTKAQQDFFKERIAHASDDELANIISAINQILEDDRDDVTQHMCDLIAYLPNKVERLKMLGRARAVQFSQLEALFQTIENFTQDFEQAFRTEIAMLYEGSELA